ncbi:MAG: T9SS C-terminal target domain-containing protein [Bacteroidetes bacterium]|nr:MAG: T9SS C-terminal target domain-containing protein [Bacteroidota bacterium]
MGQYLTQSLSYVSVLLAHLLLAFSPTVRAASFFECGMVFYDSGGPDDTYQNNEMQSWTFCPDNMGDVVNLNFVAVELEACCDELMIFNGSSAGIGNLLAGDLEEPANFLSTAEDGCLTVTFTSDGSVVRAGWEAIVSCGPPPDCANPSALDASNFTTQGAQLSWTENGQATTYELEIVLEGSTPSGVPSVSNVENPYVWTGGESGQSYDYYVRAICPDGEGRSFWIGPFNFRTLPSCGDIFYDIGGPDGDYLNNAFQEWTFCPDTPGELVTINFVLVELENCCDELAIYDGSTVSASNLLEADLEGPASFTSTSADGCLTVTFDPDGSVVRAGWEALITCNPPPACPNPSGLDAYDNTTNGATLSWFENGEATAWDLEIVPSGQDPSGTPTDQANDIIYVWTGGSSATTYDYYVRAQCPNGEETSNWVGPFTFTTTPACGDTFYDIGGPDGAYLANTQENYTICPDNEGDQVIIEFVSLDIPGDDLLIYNGTGTNELIGVVQEAGATFFSTSDDGCLTLRFIADAFGSGEGWEATVSCRMQPPCLGPTGLVVSDVSTMGATLSWTDNAGAAFWDVQFVPSGAMPGDTPTEASILFTNYTWTGAMSATTYDAYVRAQCPNSTEVTYWIGPVTFTTAPGCGSTFYDIGGPDGQYLNGESQQISICPDVAGSAVIVDFLEVDVETCCDEIEVYNGIGTAFPLNLDVEEPATFISSDPTGCLTVVFNPDASITMDGWVATVSCTPCPDYREQGTIVTIDNVRHNRADLRWDAFDQAGNYTIELGRAGFMPGEGEIIEGVGTRTRLNDLEENTDYELYLIYTCMGGDTSVVEGPLAFSTPWANDVGIVELNEPTSGCGLGSGETIRVTIANFGGLPQSLIPINFSVNGTPAGVNMPQDGLYTGVLSTDSTDQFVFDLRYDFMQVGENIIQLWTELEADSDRSNDTLTISLTQYSPPFLEDFEDQQADPGLVFDFSANITDGHGAPSFVLADNLFFFNTTFDLQLPVMSNIMPEDTFHFDYRLVDDSSELGYQLQGDQYLLATLSTDCGETFDTIFRLTANNQQSITNQMTTVSVPLAPYTGENVLIAISASSQDIISDYWVDIDNIFFSRCRNDLGLDISISDATGVNTADGAIVVRPTMGIPPFTYAWNNGASVDSLTGLQPGSYTVMVSDRFGCTEVANIEVSVVNSTTDLNGLISKIQLAPNPTSGQVLLSVDFAQARAGSYQVFNAYGQAVRPPQQWASTQRLRESIDLSSLSAGVYWIQLRSGDALSTIKLSKLD